VKNHQNIVISSYRNFATDKIVCDKGSKKTNRPRVNMIDLDLDRSLIKRLIVLKIVTSTSFYYPISGAFYNSFSESIFSCKFHSLHKSDLLKRNREKGQIVKMSNFINAFCKYHRVYLI
jgi:hypothetical protein